MSLELSLRQAQPQKSIHKIINLLQKLTSLKHILHTAATLRGAHEDLGASAPYMLVSLGYSSLSAIFRLSLAC